MPAEFTCGTCNDRGFVPVAAEGLFGPISDRIGCPDCNPDPHPLKSLQLPAPSALEDMAAGVARSAVAFYRQPENQAGAAAGILGLLFFLALKPRAKFLPAYLVAMASAGAGRQAYLVSRDVREIAKAAKDSAGDADPASA
jgi:hypothetical protein